MDSTGPGQHPVILTVAFPYARIGPHAVGGAEVVCSQVEAALAPEGFRSIVVAHAESEPQGRLYGTEIPDGTITEDVRALVEAAHQANLGRAFADHAVALVHMHGLDFHRYRIPEGVPVLVTLHLPPSWYPETIWSLPPTYQLLCVSESQRRACPATARERIVVVENGVPMPPLDSLRTGGRYALMLARICPEKNLHAGLDAARLAGLPAVLAGEVFPYEAHQRYFRGEVEPRLTAGRGEHEARVEDSGEPRARFIGAVAGAEKMRVLSRASCLLLPSLAPETSSLVAMEAMAAGIPVIGMRVGAVPEVVEEGKTGFLIEPDENAVEAMAEAIRRLPEIHRSTCRAVAEQRFPVERMVASYVALYHSLALATRPDQAATNAGDHHHAAPVDAPKAGQGHEAREVRVRRLTTTSELACLEPAWAKLWEADASATPFQHPAWLLPWWRQFGADGDLCTFALQNASNDALAGLVPAYVLRDSGGGRGRQLLLLGAGTTDYLDGVWPTAPEASGEAVLQAMLAVHGEWDSCSLPQLRADSPLVLAAGRLGLALRPAEPTSVVDVSLELPAKLRANAGRYRRRATAQGVLSVQVARDENEALSAFDMLVQMHSGRWEERGQEGVLSDARVQAHHREAIPALFRAGLLRMFQLTISGACIGVLYAFADPEQRRARTLYLYLIGFSGEFAELSPGTLLLHGVWQYARQHGFRKLDLLRGGEAYKSFWGARRETTFSVVVR